MISLSDIPDAIEGYAKRNRRNPGAVAGAFVAGAVIGSISGILFAPRSGGETRDKLKQKAKEGMDKTGEKISDVKDSAKEKAGQAVEVTKRAVNEGKQAKEDVKNRDRNRRR